ncbi:flagellar assembly peptidoglycan hydrolase FlgJ [Paraburkholderia sp.]|jgi:flagellar protein FlgJ|uniref:flagellar assembly peptidoglycan hydrolase FlgJ n=1 Tax=Paraburkholderia sp. TaxID=1926495 RepID=UPI002F40A1A5
MTTDPTSGPADISQRFALDTQGFDSLRAKVAASPQQGVRMAAKQFDATFITMMLKSMRDATPQDGPLDSRDGAQFTSMMDEQMAQQMSSKGIGVADAMLKQLMNNAGMQSGSAGSTAALNALAKAYGNPQANGSLASGVGYSRNSALTPPLHGDGTTNVDAFVDKLAASAQAASETTGVPARFIIGQAALESGWGKREIMKANGETSHNVFGIKASADWKGKTVSTVTTEYRNGQPHRVVEKFRAYDSYDEAMGDYAQLLKNNPRYAQVLNGSHDAANFAIGMQRAGYATDPHYAKKLMSIMDRMS